MGRPACIWAAPDALCKSMFGGQGKVPAWHFSLQGSLGRERVGTVPEAKRAREARSLECTDRVAGPRARPTPPRTNGTEQAPQPHRHTRTVSQRIAGRRTPPPCSFPLPCPLPRQHGRTLSPWPQRRTHAVNMAARCHHGCSLSPWPLALSPWPLAHSTWWALMRPRSAASQLHAAVLAPPPRVPSRSTALSDNMARCRFPMPHCQLLLSAGTGLVLYALALSVAL